MCDQLAEGEADGILRKTIAAAKKGDMRAAELVLARIWPVRKGRPVALDDVDGFAARYARAREIGCHALADETRAIADTPIEGVVTTTKLSREGDLYDEKRRGDMIEHRRLQVDTRKWLLARMLPAVYGDKQHVEHSGSLDIGAALEEARRRRDGRT